MKKINDRTEKFSEATGELNPVNSKIRIVARKELIDRHDNIIRLSKKVSELKFKQNFKGKSIRP